MPSALSAAKPSDPVRSIFTALAHQTSIMAVPSKPTLMQRLKRSLSLVLGKASTRESDELGRLGEAAAERHVKSLGWEIIGRNVRVPMGEADIVARDGEQFVVLEVKARVRERGQATKSAVASPLQSVTQHKRRKLRAIAAHLAKSNGWDHRRVRVDAIGVEFTRSEQGELSVVGCRVVRVA